MTNQVLDFLDIDLGLYVNNFESSSLDSSSSSSVNMFSSNPNLTSLVDKEAPTMLLPLSTSHNNNNSIIVNTNNHSNLVDAKLNSKSPVNFQPHVHRTHSYSFSSSSSSSSSCTPHAITSSNSINHSIVSNPTRSASQLLINNATPIKSKSANNEATTKKAILKYLDKKTSRKTDSNKQRIEPKLDHHHLHHHHHHHHQVYSSNNNQNANLVGQQILSNSYSSILTSDHQQTQTNNKPTFSSSSINMSPSSNSSLCSSSSSSAFDYHSLRHNSYSDAAIKSQLQQSTLSTSLHLDSSFLTSKFETDCTNEKLLAKKHSDANDHQPLMDLFTTSGASNTQTNYDDLNNLTTPTDSINQLDYVNTIIPSVAPPPPQKKQPLLLPKPAPVSNNNSHNTNQSFTYTNSATLIIPPVTQSPFITNSQISMMIPTMTNGVISRSNSQPDLTISNLDANFMNDMIVTNYSAYNNPYNSNLNSSQQISCLDAKNRPKVIRRHPSLSYKSSELNESEDAFMNGFFTSMNMENTSGGILNGKIAQNTIVNGSINGLACNNNNNDDGLFLGTDALSDFISNCGTITDLFEDLPDLEDLMSLVTFESSSSSSANALSSSVPASSLAYSHQIKQQTQCDLNLPNRIPNTTHATSASNISSNLIDCINTNPLSNYYDYCNMESSIINQSESNQDNDDTTERTTRSAPPSPTPQKKKQRPTGNNIAFNKAW